MSIFIPGFRIAGYRGFGAVPQAVAPCGKLTVVVGQNNAGKSNVLSFIHRHYRDAFYSVLNPNREILFEELDIHRGLSAADVRFDLAIPLTEEFLREMKARIPEGERERKEDFHLLWDRPPLVGDPARDDVAWLRFVYSPEAKGFVPDYQWVASFEHEHAFLASVFRHFASSETRSSPNESGMHASSIVNIAKLLPRPPDASFIPAIRFVRSRADNPTSLDQPHPPEGELDLSGIDLIDALGRLDRPPLESRDSDRASFESIERFLGELIGRPGARIVIPHDHSVLLVEADGRTLPLSHLGTGIQEVLVLAVAATRLSERIVCIEEPELHLHPALQRQLLQYLDERTSNQYFIATHSAHLMNRPNAALMHVQQVDGATRIDVAAENRGYTDVCRDLGYHPSDLLQANCVIWVEGPSDRTYLRYWIRAVDPSLREGIEYAIMFYGGALLSYVTADETPDVLVDSFVQLRNLNRHSAIMIDSDKRSAEEEINATKKRVVESFNEQPGLAWVTAGRDVENYVPAAVLRDAILEVHAGAELSEFTDAWSDVMSIKRKKATKWRDADKPRVAHAVVQRKPSLDVLDLRERIEKLAAFIHSANPGLSTVA